MLMQMFLQTLSLLGAVSILAAFIALQRRWWTSERPAYLWLNLVGAVLLGIVAIADRRAGFIVVEAVWVAVTLHLLLRLAGRSDASAEP